MQQHHFFSSFIVIFRLLAILIILIIGVTIADFIRISKYQTLPLRPTEKISLEQNQLYYDLTKGGKDIDWSRLEGTLKYIDQQYDCADFRFVNLIRIMYEYGNIIPEKARSKVEKTLFNFRYWWDEPGENSMCYWSENHQILFASAEYLIGQKYPNTVFERSGLTGQEHMQKARERILDWLEMRWKYGFTEFYSSVYYKEDIGAMINLIDFAKDQELVKKTQIIMDLLFYDVATQNVHKMFISSSGRAYKGNRLGGPDATLGGLTNYYWGDGKQIGSGMMFGMMTTENYSLPPVLMDIARDTSTVVIKQSNGLDISELKTEGYFGTDNRSMMMQWGMEAFTNPEVVRNSISHIRSNNMFSNGFIGDFKILDFSFLRFFHLEPALVRMINPQSNGVAIQKGNTYTYKTKDYSLYTAQEYHPGTYGDQQHIAGMNISNSFSIFHTHPALEAHVQKQSPNYWVGYGHIPHAAQDSNVSLAIYDLPKKKGLMEEALLDYTFAYFPQELFDEILLKDNSAFGKKGDTYCAFIGKNTLSFRKGTTDNLIQPGKQTFWITEAGSKTEDGSFDAFCQRILINELTFDPGELALTYQSNGSTYQLIYKKGFSVNNEKVNTNYQRFDSPYSRAKKKPATIIIEFNEKILYLDFYNLVREF